MPNSNEYYVIGDGNCGPRAIIQSLLLEGLAYPDHKKFVCAFFRNLCQKHKKNMTAYVESPRHLSNPSVSSPFGKHDPRPASNLRDDTLYKLPLTQKLDLEKQILDFIDTYEHLESTEKNLASLIQAFIPQKRGVAPTHDHLTYMLAAYLRFDMQAEIVPTNSDTTIQQFYRDVWPDLVSMGSLPFLTPIAEIVEANGTLERNTHAAFIACYLAKHRIGYSLIDNDSSSKQADNDNYFAQREPTLSIITRTTGLHFSVEWRKPTLLASAVAQNSSDNDKVPYPPSADQANTTYYPFIFNVLSQLAMIPEGVMLVISLLLLMPRLAIRGACMFGSSVINHFSTSSDETEQNKSEHGPKLNPS
jgi:hypothetical protein